MTTGVTKASVSIPTQVFQEGERTAEHLRLTRSELYARALEEFIKAHTPDALKAAYDELYSDPEITEEDGRLLRAMEHTTGELWRKDPR
jgi:metal-responsive CopG/Arc/MetJ family transcriptional regulator